MRLFLLALLLVLPALGRTADPFLCKPLNLRAVVPGKVFRSADLPKLTSAEEATLKNLHLRTLVDLRSTPEVLRYGKDRPVAVKAVHMSLPPLAGSEGYEEYTRLRKEFGEVFHLLAQASTYPVLFHCHRGKDRTGVVAALLQDLLGVPREEIYLDYLRSTEVGPGPENEVQRAWLDIIFDAVDRAGGIEAYLTSAGVTPAEQANIRKLLR
jgi:protein-tyrosine phosphatase